MGTTQRRSHRSLKRIYHPFWLWEDVKAGMWRKASLVEEDDLLPKAIEFTGNAPLYGSYMRMVSEEWTYSCEHNLTEVSMNRRAWIGHAACCMAIGCPEYLTRRAWWMLTQEQRDAADAEADNAILQWEIRQRDTKQLALPI